MLTAILLLLVALPSASAHPFGDDYGAQRLDLRIDRDGVDVGYTADVPLPLLGARGKSDLSAIFTELAAGVVLTADGQTVPLTLVHQAERTDLVTMHTTVIDLVFRADLDLSEPTTLTLSNANLGGVPSYHFASVRVDPSVSVLSTSLLATPKLQAPVDLNETWTRSELRRRVVVTARADDRPWARLIDRIVPGQIPVGQATLVPPLTAWARRSPTAAGLLPGLWVAAVLGLATGARLPRRTAGATITLALIFAVAVAGLPSLSQAAYANLAAVLLGGALWATLLNTPIPLVLGAVLGGTGPTGALLATAWATAAAVGLTFPGRRAPSPLVAAGLFVAAAMVALRAG